MRILAVGMLDVATFKRDEFYVEVGPDAVILYEARLDGTVVPRHEKPSPRRTVDSAVTKFDNGYLLDCPIAIQTEKELVAFLGRFEPTGPATCRLAR